MAKYDVTATIVTYNNDVACLRKAISSFLNTNLRVKIYISDNSETSDIKNHLIKDDRIQYIFNNANNGFGAGHNVIISKVIDQSRYHVILNPDIEYNDAHLLERLIDFADSKQRIGAVMPKVKYPDGSLQYLAKLLPTPFDLMTRRFAPFLANPKFDLKFTGYDRTMLVPFITGCFMMVKTEVFKEVGQFDERYFMYCEDIDLSRRINEKFETYYYPEVEIVHHYAKASYSNTNQLKVHITSAIKYFNKWGWVRDSFRRDLNAKALKSITEANSMEE